MTSSFRSGFNLLVVTGPTASGKTSLAAAVASVTGGEIISADSRQVYRGMNLGTGKDYDDYYIQGRQVKCHLIDIADPGYKYNVFEFQRDFIRVFTDMEKRKVFPVLCGGSGMYIDSIVSGYNMAEVPPDTGLRARLEKKTIKELAEILSSYRSLHNVTDLDSKKRVIRAIEIEHYSKIKPQMKSQLPAVRPLIVGILYERNERRRRISERLNHRLEAGMVEEVSNLLECGISKDTMIRYGLEYKFITLYLSGLLEYDQMVIDLEIAINQFAKRQMTWFRGMERKGIKIHWLEGSMPADGKIDKVLSLLSPPE
jgi:tRNA dimethylallyltransferase